MQWRFRNSSVLHWCMVNLLPGVNVLPLNVQVGVGSMNTVRMTRSYSTLRPDIGSMLAARRAGIRLAIRATDNTLEFYEGGFHYLLNNIDKESIMLDIKSWIDGRLPVAVGNQVQTQAVSL